MKLHLIALDVMLKTMFTVHVKEWKVLKRKGRYSPALLYTASDTPTSKEII
jgi:hypothetical protein